MYTLAELAELVGGEVHGPGDLPIQGIASLEDATLNDISFVDSTKHLPQALDSAAKALIVGQDIALEELDKPVIRTENPRLAFATLLEHFAPVLSVELGVHPSAVIGEGVQLGEGCSIGAHVVIEADATIGDNVIVYPGTYIGQGSVIGDNTIIYPNVVIREYVEIGANVIIQPGAVLGGDGFGFVTVKGKHHKVPHIGKVIIEDDVEIGANVTIDRATCGRTVVGRGTKIDNLVQLGHNVVVGEDCLIVAMVGIAGSATIGNRVTVAGQAGIAGHLQVGDDTVVAARSLVIGSVPPRQFVSGSPARDHGESMRAIAAQRRVPDLIKRVRELEKELEALKTQLAGQWD